MWLLSQTDFVYRYTYGLIIYNSGFTFVDIVGHGDSLIRTHKV